VEEEFVSIPVVLGLNPVCESMCMYTCVWEKTLCLCGTWPELCQCVWTETCMSVPVCVGEEIMMVLGCGDVCVERKTCMYVPVCVGEEIMMVLGCGDVCVERKTCMYVLVCVGVEIIIVLGHVCGERDMYAYMYVCVVYMYMYMYI
jgi:hypothetical protein